MRVAALGFLLGIVCLQQLSFLPALPWSFSMPVFVLLWVLLPRWRFVWCMGIGFFWASLSGHYLMAHSLDYAQEGKDLVVDGYVSSLPEKAHRRIQFQFEPLTLSMDGEVHTSPRKLLLSWYGFAPDLRVGERWRLQVRLKRPHGMMNPGGFDYEGWLLQQGIRAKGYVRKAKSINRRLALASGHYPVDQLREALRDRLADVLENHELRGIINALAIGDRQSINPEQWGVLTRTGTSHLVAISGLHIGLVAGFAFFMVSRLWKTSVRLITLWPAKKAGAMAGLLSAACYAMLAGFSIPTQRALVMVAVVMLAVILQRHTRPGYVLACALWLVLVLDPIAVMAPGFWLSFAAVAFILYGMTGRVGVESSWRKWWWQWGRVQWLVTLGLLPILLLLFQKASIVSPMANLIAVPWVSLITVPLVLSGVAFLVVFPPLADSLLGLATLSLDGLWWILQSMSDWHFSQWYRGMPGVWVLFLAVIGMGWLLAPRGIPGRWVGLICLLPVGFASSGELNGGEARFALLDVGQGLAAVVRTREHTLVFDTGPRFSSGFNTGGAVVAPYLRVKGVNHIDMLVVSHGDIDHIGGVEDLASQVPVKRTISSVPGKLVSLNATACRAGEKWQWDGVMFEILNPGDGPLSRKGRKDNNRSCVLRVEAGSESVLLTGDIEKGAEQQLVHRIPGKLASTVLVVPHHGSKTSSSPSFIDAVSPRMALFPVGYRNRYGFPKAAVIRRFESRHIRLLDSARHGAIEFRLGGVEKLENTLSTWRQKGAHYWHNQSQDAVSIL